ncbi:MAG: circularly permuted type 2 ATP-grasp protein [Dehalococcoidia bacterium]|nr:circularly permuted type 2 ATP-grasp protein [Dehalococcoidia bacterium]
MLTDAITIRHFLNECLDPDGSPTPVYQSLVENLDRLGVTALPGRWREAKHRADLDAFTFMLDPREFRTVPTDWVPRIIPADEWDTIARGVAQRLKVINRFLLDLYCGEQQVVPPDVMYSCQYYNPELQDYRPAQDVFVHIYGIDLVHMGDGRYVILEDNLRIPSGISYQLKTTELGLNVMPELAQGYDIVPYDIRAGYHDMFASLCDTDDPVCVILTDSKLGSAFFEHRYLSELLGIPLVEGSDLYIGANGRVWGHAIDGDFEVDLIYRRVEDLELFVPGLTEAYLNHKVVLVNAIGTGAGDDKLVFLWVPDMIKTYLGEEAILEQATSYDLRSPANRQYVLQNLDSLVLKTRQGYGGLGVFIMPDLDKGYRSRLSQQLIEQPQVFIAQETLDFSQHLVFDEFSGKFEERYVDLRVFAVQNGRGEVTVFPGGLTRVSEANSRVTNNSSGGSCKPTWVVR